MRDIGIFVVEEKIQVDAGQAVECIGCQQQQACANEDNEEGANEIENFLGSLRVVQVWQLSHLQGLVIWLPRTRNRLGVCNLMLKANSLAIFTKEVISMQ